MSSHLALPFRICRFLLQCLLQGWGKQNTAGTVQNQMFLHRCQAQGAPVDRTCVLFCNTGKSSLCITFLAVLSVLNVQMMTMYCVHLVFQKKSIFFHNITRIYEQQRVQSSILASWSLSIKSGCDFFYIDLPSSISN